MRNYYTKDAPLRGANIKKNKGKFHEEVKQNLI